VLGLIDAKGLGDATRIRRVRVIPSRRQLDQGKLVGGIAIHLVRGQKDEHTFRGIAPDRFKQVEVPTAFTSKSSNGREAARS
jgi:hypothetical protein